MEERRKIYGEESSKDWRAHWSTPPPRVHTEDSLQFLVKHLVCSCGSTLPTLGLATGELFAHLESSNFPPAWGIFTVQQLGI